MLGHLFNLALLVAGAFAVSRTSPPAGALVVAKSGGQYTTLQAAINAVPTTSTGTTTIFIQPGSYSGQVVIPKVSGKIVIYGYTTEDQDYTKNQVTITNRLSAADAGSNDLSATLRVAANNLSVYSLNIVNTYGQGSQALAVSANGNYHGYYGCSFVGYQDTVYVNKPHQVFKNCYIEGATDFIFGNDGNVWFEQCTIAINGKGYITASGRDSADEYWYVLNQAKVITKPGVSLAAGSTYLGRPWREYARTVFQNSDLGGVVNSAGWSAWGSNPTGNVYYAEFGNKGTGASGTRVGWSKKLSSAVSIDSILPGYTSWVDMNYWNNSGGGTNPPPTSTSAPPPPTSTSSAPNPGCTGALYGQCGGSGWTGCVNCPPGSTCKFSNDWYSQCL